MAGAVVRGHQPPKGPESRRPKKSSSVRSKSLSHAVGPGNWRHGAISFLLSCLATVILLSKMEISSRWKNRPARRRAGPPSQHLRGIYLLGRSYGGAFESGEAPIFAREFSRPM